MGDGEGKPPIQETEPVALTHEQLTDELGAELANCTIGFVNVTFKKVVENGQTIITKDATSGGSGTLIKIGSIEGVLTAGHVIDALSSMEEVGLVTFNRALPNPQAQTVDIDWAEAVLFYEAKNGPDGPDIGFLRLPEKNISNLKATHSFLELKQPEQLNSAALDSFVGVVNEWTSELEPLQLLDPTKPPLRRKHFKLLLGSGSVSSPRTEHGFDLFDLYPRLTPPPSTYAGVSGGAVWRVYVDPVEDCYVVKEKQLIGIAFHELQDEGGKHRLICHGPSSIYERLIPEVLNKIGQS